MSEPNTKPLRTIRDFIRYATTRLYESPATFMHGYDNPMEEASFLVLRSLSLPLESEIKFLDSALAENERKKVLTAISRRCDQLVPTAYIVNEWWLTGYDFYVDERVLIPRSFIAELLEDQLTPWITEPESVNSVLDMCTGSACLGILATNAFPMATVDCVDISPDALEVARINIKDYGLEDIVTPIQSDLFSNLEGKKYDVIISNPPYVTQKAMDELPGEYRHEPSLALVAGDDGMDIVKRLIADAKKHLNDGGVLIVEIGDGRQAFEEAFPELPAMWLTTSAGDDMVFLVHKEDLP
ncbi:MAG: 50S ribosomal protein L3 N(5)-glutamine methyltransferase [Burkholderiaceae bacterium]|nr:50S ribosomal protein L3 N(5)-glutamine methyltransferase [Burkholderiaceae bacterium]